MTKPDYLHDISDIHLEMFNFLENAEKDIQGTRIWDLSKLFFKQVIFDKVNTLISSIDVETLTVPGFIGIADTTEKILDPENNRVNGYEDVRKLLNTEGLLICTYQYNKDRYGAPINLVEITEKQTQDWSLGELNDFRNFFINNEGHHTGTMVPATRKDDDNESIDGFAFLNEPDDYHKGLFGDQGFVAVAQSLIFSEPITKEQSLEYCKSIICWMSLLNPFVEFPENYNQDGAHVRDVTTLQEILRHTVKAALGNSFSREWLKNKQNHCYCSEFVFLGINSVLYPFNRNGLTKLLKDEENVDSMVNDILALQKKHNDLQQPKTILSDMSNNPVFQKREIKMPEVDEKLNPLDEMITDHEGLPLQPLKLSQLLRLAFSTILPRKITIEHPHIYHKIFEIEVKMWIKVIELTFKTFAPPLSTNSKASPRLPDLSDLIEKINPYVEQLKTTLKNLIEQSNATFEELDKTLDTAFKNIDNLFKDEDLYYYAPPRIFIDWGQEGSDKNTLVPDTWGIKFKTQGVLIYKGVIKHQI
ncbi:hypothetical protein PCC7424_4373 [Gloeothece citriformis PCC 7424]|uniref:Uncharacterized protein n=1 Tax=Gloeothece citriformis (strain PCC 7424) TaxID=65393 RepID=B7K8W9_GLOC7|nr:hypothetical protein [Gloeothece citriformis]ACK72738.1 hypothetical protein PCC7424_4373 [Gloeothece citriformis PCC 7424]